MVNPVGPSQATGQAASNGQASATPTAPLSLSPGTRLWALVSESTPLASQPKLAAATEARLQQLLQQALSNPQKPAQGHPAQATQADATQADTIKALTQLLRTPIHLVQARIGQHPITLLADRPVPAGQTLPLRADRGGLTWLAGEAPQTTSAAKAAPPLQTPLLQFSRNVSPPQLSNAQQSALMQVLRHALPQQQPTAQWLTKLQPWLNAPNGSTNPAATNKSTQSAPTPLTPSALPTKPTAPGQQPNPLMQLATNALTLPTDSQSLRNAVANSGLFAEAKLASATQPQSDAKLLLWQLLGQPNNTAQTTKPATDLLSHLLQLLQPATPSQTSHVPNTQTAEPLKALALQWLTKIVTQQAQHLLDNTTPGEWRLNLELPLKVDQQWLPLQLNFHKYWLAEDDDADNPSQQQSAQAKPVWQVTLSVEIAALGPLDARVRYSDDQLHCTLWAAQPETLKLVTQEAEVLRQKLHARGLKVHTLECHAGRLPTRPNTLSSPLLDTHA
ncbi:flagellar hook-length control protein FliK [Simiduia aestuariiviva]|nr:flagellar hook-length control protein FliK [Simiduia aestuariiviva]